MNICEQENQMEYETQHNQDKISNLNNLIQPMSNSILITKSNFIHLQTNLSEIKKQTN